MERTLTNSPGYIGRACKRMLMLPLQAVKFVLKHPVLVCTAVLLGIWMTFSTLAHFNPTISKRFNNAVAYFGAATVASIAADSASAALSVADKRASTSIAEGKKQAVTNRGLSAELDAERSRVKALNTSNTVMKNRIAVQAGHIDELGDYISQQNQKMNKSTGELSRANAKLADLDARLVRFQNRGKQLSSKAGRQLTKVALVDSAGELIGWVPIVGDIASVGLTAGGIYQMCQMFKEIESATQELGVPYQVYTDTFCQKPVAKTREMVAEKGADVWGYLGDRVFYTQQYWIEKTRTF